jgi:hypothetical protein
MNRKLLSLLAFLLVGVASVPAVFAQETIGYVNFFNPSAGEAEFDITNLTGVNSFENPDPLPVVTSVNLSSLNLVVTFASGPVETFGPSYFTLDADGISWDGTPVSTTVGQPTGFAGAISATLTGDFSPTTLTLTGGTIVTVDSTFLATITDPSGPLMDGDLAIITATNGMSGGSSVPEPESLLMVATGFASLIGYRRRSLLNTMRKVVSG